VANVGGAIVTIVRGAGGEVRDSEWAKLPFFAKFRQGRGNLDAELDPPRPNVIWLVTSQANLTDPHSDKWALALEGLEHHTVRVWI
jgi:hypothetical protein